MNLAIVHPEIESRLRDTLHSWLAAEVEHAEPGHLIEDRYCVICDRDGRD